MEIIPGGRKPLVFTPAQIIKAFNADYLDADKCRRLILKAIHGNRAACPNCFSNVKLKQLIRFWSGNRLKCKACNCMFTAITKTVLDGSQLLKKKSRVSTSAPEQNKHAKDFRRLFLLVVLLGFGLDNKKIAAAVGVSPEAVRLNRKRFESIAEVII